MNEKLKIYDNAFKILSWKTAFDVNILCAMGAPPPLATQLNCHDELGDADELACNFARTMLFSLVNR